MLCNRNQVRLRNVFIKHTFICLLKEASVEIEAFLFWESFVPPSPFPKGYLGEVTADVEKAL